jgi:hypothetical protein
MKTTIQLTSDDLKVGLIPWMAVSASDTLKSVLVGWLTSRGIYVDAAATFEIDSSDNVTVTITNAPVAPAVSGHGPIIATAPPPITSPTATGPTDVSSNPPNSTTSIAFDKAFAFVIKWEGLMYEDVSGDPGGPTKYGIDQKDHPDVDIKNLTLDQAKAIYLTVYWQGSNCDNLPYPVAKTHFNFSVNVGREQSIKFMQAAMGIAVDGQFGLLTAGALSRAVPKTVALGMVDQADAFYKDLATKGQFAKFLIGWLNRNNDLRSLINAG